MTEHEPSRDPSRRHGLREGTQAYQGALEAVLAILVAGFFGYCADEWLDSSPRWLIVGTVVGFGSFVLRLWRMRKLFEADAPGSGSKKD